MGAFRAFRNPQTPPGPSPAARLPASDSRSATVTSLAAPSLTGLAPNQGPVSGGNTVTLTGTSLTNASAVRFGSTASSFTVVSATQITATAPPGPVGPVQVTVTTPGGTSNALTYTQVSPPAI